MVQTTKPVYSTNNFGTKDQNSYDKKSQFDFKSQDKKAMTKTVEKKADPWGKTFKSEQHFKSLHICWAQAYGILE